jgi:hypothetical protein
MVTSSVADRDSLYPYPDQDPGFCHFDDKKFKNSTVENKFKFFSSINVISPYEGVSDSSYRRSLQTSKRTSSISKHDIFKTFLRVILPFPYPETKLNPDLGLQHL